MSDAAQKPEDSATPETEVIEVETVPKTRFNEVYRQMKENERKALELEKKLSFKSEEREKPETENKRPALEDFDYDEEAYLEALTEHKIESRLNAREKAKAAEAKAAETKKKQDDFIKQVETFAKDNPEYIELGKKSQDIKYSPAVYEAVLESGNMAVPIDFFLLKNPEVVDELNKLHPVTAAIEIGKIAATLKASPSKDVSKAPPPIDTITGGGTSSSDVLYRKDIDPDDFYKHYTERMG